MGEAPVSSGLLTRRALLRTGLFGAAAVVVGGSVVALRETRLRPLPSSGLRVLSASEFSTLAAIADRVAPGARNAPIASALQIAERVDTILDGADPEAQQGLKIALTVFESGLTGALFGERITPFTQLSADAQDAVLEAWRTSTVLFRRTVHYSLVSMCAALYCGDKRAWYVSGYPGPPSPKGLRTAFSMNLVDLHALRVGGKPGTTPDLPPATAEVAGDTGGDAGVAADAAPEKVEEP